jgi:hypothetical protein
MMDWKQPALAEIGRTIELETAAKIAPDRRVDWWEAYARIGELDRAWPELQRLLAAPNYLSVNELRLNPAFDPFRDDPRFQKLLETKKL